MNKINIDIATLPQTERIIGLTLPVNGIMYVCGYDEVFQLNLGKSISFEMLDDAPYEFFYSQANSLGINGNKPILRYQEDTIAYEFDPHANCIEIDCQIAEKAYTLKFNILSGDWFVASFSTCGKYLVLAEPYNFNIYQIERSID